jgi:hypothetical protein
MCDEPNGPSEGGAVGGGEGTLTAPIAASEIRAELAALVLRDLLGPAGGPVEEVAESRVSDRYLVGMLAPLNRNLDPATDEDVAEAGAGTAEEGSPEPGTAPIESTFPSSFGFTVSVAGEARALRITARWGRYERRDSETRKNERTGNPEKVWKRIQMEGGIVPVALEEGPIEPRPPVPGQPEVVVQGLVRRRDEGWIVTLFLVNGQTEPDRLKDEQWLFQPELVVESVDGEPIFVRRPVHRDPDRMEGEAYRESAEMAMLHRRHVEFGVGHGVAVSAEMAPGDPWRARRVATRVMPTYEVPQQTSPTPADPGFEALASVVLDMKRLAETPSDRFGTTLGPLVAVYRDWIARERAKLSDPAQGLKEHDAAARRAIERCARALIRMEAGLDLLGRDERAAEAFRFANRAMWLQRIHTLYAEGRRRGSKATLDEIDADPANHRWYPFQLAFVLLNLPASTDLHHPDRSHGTEAVVDLLWFPTGGGKTEAYLGLAAYVMGLRRLQGEIEGRAGEDGVAVLMRYTLRLLTLQQFQRATALICACEEIRRSDVGRWGGAPFRIGLWVGMRATPNSTDQAYEWVQQARGGGWKGKGVGVGTPAQLTNCPWCGNAIGPGRDIDVERASSGRGRTLIYCGDPLGNCPFSRRGAPGEGLPVLVVDEEIYRLLPSLLIATVDKFAQLPWNGRTQMLFGQVDGHCPRHGFRSPEVEDAHSHPKRGALPAVKSVPHLPVRPPDLVIQDELHLISGPLGSLVGLYETAVDELCAWTVGGRRVRPKVVASTATVRNALAQVNSLFLRKVEVFPPPGTSIDDNFFSLRREPSAATPGRLYVGICAPGKRLKAVLIRTYVAFLGAAQLLYEQSGKDADPWMTLVGYFNSIRELAGMRRLVDDDVKTRLRGIDRWGLGNRALRYPEELTSRKSSTDIPEILDRLEIEFDPEDDRKREQLRKEGKPPHKPHPYDVLLATNMVSVGVDVKRLGLMVVGGQPKTTAEYIQATSRVGRHRPGVVATVYNWARPRDLSHYERFEHYHATFYSHVEALSVTPFAARALDRALSALLVALVRLPGGAYNQNSLAGAVKRDHAYVQRAIEAIAARAGGVAIDKDVGVRVKAELEQRLDTWLARAARAGGGQHLGYRARKDGVTVPLLKPPSEEDWDTFTCLNSLRDVEPTSGFVLVDDGLSDSAGDPG